MAKNTAPGNARPAGHTPARDKQVIKPHVIISTPGAPARPSAQADVKPNPKGREARGQGRPT